MNEYGNFLSKIESITGDHDLIATAKTLYEDIMEDDAPTEYIDEPDDEDVKADNTSGIDINIQQQPDGITCGPTSLSAIYDYVGLDINVGKLRKDLEILNQDNGTYAQVLGLDALKRGFSATLYVYNFDIVDPTWKDCESSDLVEKLKQRKKIIKDDTNKQEIDKYIKFIELGGMLRVEDLSMDIFQRYFEKKIPLICMLCCTYLYGCSREYTKDKESVLDDINGSPCGHFVVAYGFSKDGKIMVADPDTGNPYTQGHHYECDLLKFSNAIMLDNGSILAIEPSV